MPLLLTARHVLPITSAPLSPGAVVIDEARIVAVGAPDALRAQFPMAYERDFGQAAIMPGLVNTHTHLELTALRGRLENLSFPQWISALVTYKREQMTDADLLASARAGCAEAIRAGITTVADTADATVTWQAMIESGLRGILYQECFGPAPEQAEASIDQLKQKLDQHRQTLASAPAAIQARLRIGISPHAPFSVSARLYQMLARLAQSEHLDMALHVAESREESLLLREGRGYYADMLAGRGIPWTTPGCSTIQYLDRLGVLEAAPLLIHCVTVNDKDIELMAARKARIAHCPKSNAKLGHGIAPLLKFQQAGICTGLGSDSVASNNTCDMIEEARFAALLQQAMRADGTMLSAETMLRLMTIEGARALRMENEIGSLEPGKQADLITIDLSAIHNSPADDPAAAIVFSSNGRDVVFTMVAGQILYDKNTVAPDPALRPLS